HVGVPALGHAGQRRGSYAGLGGDLLPSSALGEALCVERGVEGLRVPRAELRHRECIQGEGSGWVNSDLAIAGLIWNAIPPGSIVVTPNRHRNKETPRCPQLLPALRCTTSPPPPLLRRPPARRSPTRTRSTSP